MPCDPMMRNCIADPSPGPGISKLMSTSAITPFANLNTAIAKELIKTGRTERPVTGFKSRAGKNFRSRLALMQTEEGRWRVEFDEPWAKEGAKPPEADDAAAGETTDAVAAASPDAGDKSAAAA